MHAMALYLRMGGIVFVDKRQHSGCGSGEDHTDVGRLHAEGKMQAAVTALIDAITEKLRNLLGIAVGDVQEVHLHPSRHQERL